MVWQDLLLFFLTWSCRVPSLALRQPGPINTYISNYESHFDPEKLTDVGVLRLLAVFAFGLGAATFLGAGAFLGSATLAEAFFVAAAFFLEAVGLTAVSFCRIILSDCCTLGRLDHNRPWRRLASSR